jgi:hypothetical protein
MKQVFEKKTETARKTRVRGNLTAVVWKDKRDMNMLMNMHHPPAEGNFYDEHGNTLKSAIAQDYNRHMGYVDSYTISRWT